MCHHPINFRVTLICRQQCQSLKRSGLYDRQKFIKIEAQVFNMMFKHPTQMKILHQAFICFELLDTILQLKHLFVLAYVHYFLFVISSYAISLFVCFAINVFNLINLTYTTFSEIWG